MAIFAISFPRCCLVGLYVIMMDLVAIKNVVMQADDAEKTC